jgi:hypothetical protein
MTVLTSFLDTLGAEAPAKGGKKEECGDGAAEVWGWGERRVRTEGRPVEAADWGREQQSLSLSLSLSLLSLTHHPSLLSSPAPSAPCFTSLQVCRYTQMPESHQTGGCMHCGEPEDLWMCLICGFMGCTSLLIFSRSLLPLH